jgi:hypothetical protein
MKITTKLTALSSAIFLSLGLTACGGGGGDTTASASSIISSGTITGFGSVYVNGVKFETNSSSFNIEGTAGTQDELAIGMVVQVNGVINPDGITGTATSIVFDDDLQGPVANYVLSADGLTAAFTVMGINAQIDSKTTYFDPDNGGIAINSITNDQFVELSGFFDANDTLIASRIENKNGSDSNVELKGNITGLNGRSFTLKGIAVDASTARLEDLPNGLQEGTYVEVKGSFNGTQIIATKVESEEFEYGDSDEFEMEGFITDFTGNQFKVNGITVDISNTPKMEPRNMQLANNLQIEVEGRLIGSTLFATELKMRTGEVELQAYISSVDYDNSTFEVTLGTNNKTLTIATGIETQFEDDIDGFFDTRDISNRLKDLQVGQFVEIEGYQDDTGNIFAVEVEIKRDDEVEIQGVLENIQSNQVTVLGVNFSIDSRTRFEDDDTSLTQAQFEARVSAGQSWIKVEDTNHDGFADKIELES